MLSPSRSPSRGSRMLEAADGASLRTFNTLLFLCTISLILKSSGGELISSHQPITALMGDDVILPCRLNNPTDVRSETVVWTKPGLDPVFIHVHQNGRLVYQSQHPSYRYRTTLFEDQLVNGNVSLKLSRVKISDAGTYVCSIQSMGTEASVELLVGAASTPVIDSVESDVDGGRLVLRCKSSGWYPQPELSWLDSEGHVLPAGPTETLTGPGGLYSVNSIVTVDNRGSSRFTCRVQQKDINQIRETHIQVSADVITTSSLIGLGVAGGVGVLISFIVCILIPSYIRRYQMAETKRPHFTCPMNHFAKDTTETMTAKGNTKENEDEDYPTLSLKGSSEQDKISDVYVL